MVNGKKLEYFLGNNSSEGFVEQFENIFQDERGFLWIIKGGAGCGKSTFMKNIGNHALQKGLEAHFVYCSGDPDSLDAVIIPELNVAYMDGTSPHSHDVNLVAMDTAFLNLGEFYGSKLLKPQKEDLLKLLKGNSDAYIEGYRLLKAAGEIRKSRDLNYPKEALNRGLTIAEEIIQGVAQKVSEKTGTIRKINFSAITFKGIISNEDTVENLCSTRYIFESLEGFVPDLLEKLSKKFEKLGYSCLLAMDCLNPNMPEALIVKDLSLGFFAGQTNLSEKIDGITISFDESLEKQKKKDLKLKNKAKTKLIDELIEEAIENFAKAKAIHDDIEKIFVPTVDFKAIDQVLEKHLKELELK